MTCPRCKTGRMFPDREGDLCCMTCGHAIYKLAPLEAVAEEMKKRIKISAGGYHKLR